MRIQFEINERLPEIIEEILHSERWITSVREELTGRKIVVIRDPSYASEAIIEIYSNEVSNGTAKFDHPRKVYDEFIKEDYVVVKSKE